MTDSPQQICRGPIRSALNNGRHSNPEWYEGFERITGSALSEATFEDFTVWFFCTPAKRQTCPGLTLPEGRECNPTTTITASTSTTTDSPPLVCGGPIRWALNNGRHSNPEWYDGFERITGRELSEATLEDFTVWFYCTPAKRQSCPGLALPEGRQCNQESTTTSSTSTTFSPTSAPTSMPTSAPTLTPTDSPTTTTALPTAKPSSGPSLASAGPIYDEPNTAKVSLMKRLLSGPMSRRSFNRVGNSAYFILRQERQGDELHPDVRSGMRRIRLAKQQGYSRANWNIMRRRFNLLNL